MNGSVRVEQVAAHGTFSDAAAGLSVRTGAPVLPHADDHEPRARTHPGRTPDGELTDCQILTGAGIELQVLHNPSLYAPPLNAVFIGGTLFHGGPGATGRSCSDRPAIEASVGDRLLTLPGDTLVPTGHGRDTTIAAERSAVPAA